MLHGWLWHQKIVLKISMPESGATIVPELLKYCFPLFLVDLKRGISIESVQKAAESFLEVQTAPGIMLSNLSAP